MHIKPLKTFRGSLETQDQPWSFNGPFRAPNRDLMILWGHFWLCLKILHLYSLAPLTMLKHLIVHCTTLPGLRGSSLVFMDPFMDPKKDPARLKTTDKLEFTAKFQVKRTFGSGAIAILRQRMIAPPPYIRVKVDQHFYFQTPEADLN